MEEFSLRIFSLGLVHLERKNDVQLIFADSYICYVIEVNGLQSSFVLVLLMEQLFLKKFFSSTCTFRGKN